MVICYDADSAGVQAANRAIPMLEKTGLKVKVLRVTGAKDPDEFLRSFGRDAFARLLDQSENYVEYNLRQLQSGYDLTNPLQKAEFAGRGRSCWPPWTAPVEREVYAGQLSEMTGVGKAALSRRSSGCQDQRLRAAKKKQTRGI